MNYLQKLQSVKIGDVVYIKCRDFPARKTTVINIDGDIITVGSNGNSGHNWTFSKKTSYPLTPPFAYWISTEERNNP